MINLGDLLFNEESGDINQFQEITILTFTFTEGTQDAVIKIHELNPEIKINLILNYSQKNAFLRFIDDDVDLKSKIKGIFLSNELNNHSKIIVLNSITAIRLYVGSFNFNSSGLESNIEIGNAYTAFSINANNWFKMAEEVYNSNQWINFSDNTLVDSILDFINLIIIKGQNNTINTNEVSYANMLFMSNNIHNKQYFIHNLAEESFNNIFQYIKGFNPKNIEIKIISPYINYLGIKEFYDKCNFDDIKISNFELISNYLPQYRNQYAEDNYITQEDYINLKKHTDDSFKFKIWHREKETELNLGDKYDSIIFRKKFIHAKTYLFKLKFENSSDVFISFVGSPNLTSAVWRKNSNIEAGILDVNGNMSLHLFEFINSLALTENCTFPNKEEWKLIDETIEDIKYKSLFEYRTIQNITDYKLNLNKNYYDELVKLNLDVQFEDFLNYTNPLIELKIYSPQTHSNKFVNFPLSLGTGNKLSIDFNKIDYSKIEENYLIEQIRLKVNSNIQFPVLRLKRTNNKIISNRYSVNTAILPNKQIVKIGEEINLALFPEGTLFIYESSINSVNQIILFNEILHKEAFTDVQKDVIQISNKQFIKISLKLKYPFSLYDFKFNNYTAIPVEPIGYKVDGNELTFVFCEDVKSFAVDKKYHRFFENYSIIFDTEKLVLNNAYLPFDTRVKQIKFTNSDAGINLVDNKYIQKHLEKFITEGTELIIDAKNVKVISYRFSFYSHTIDNQDFYDIKKPIICLKPFSKLEIKPLNLVEGYYLVGKPIEYEIRPLIFSSNQIDYETLEGFKGGNDKFINIQSLPVIPSLKGRELNNLLENGELNIYSSEIKDSNLTDFKRIEFTEAIKAKGFFIKANKNIKDVIIVPITNTNYGHYPLIIKKDRIIGDISYQHEQLIFKEWFMKYILGLKPDQTLPGKINGLVLYDYNVHKEKIESWFMNHFQIIEL